MKKAVLWDMDGTLLDSEQLHVSALSQAMEVRGLTVPDDLHLHVTGMAADDVYRWLVRDLGLVDPFADWIEIKYRNYMNRIDEVRPFPEATGLWQRLKGAGIKQAVVSNSDRLIVDANLNHLQLGQAHQVTVSRNDVRRGKPDPESYLRAAWLLEVDPADAIVLEDSPTGVQAGVAAGMASYMIPYTPLAAPVGVQKLDTLDQIAEMCGL